MFLENSILNTAVTVSTLIICSVSMIIPNIIPHSMIRITENFCFMISLTLLLIFIVCVGNTMTKTSAPLAMTAQ